MVRGRFASGRPARDGFNSLGQDAEHGPGKSQPHVRQSIGRIGGRLLEESHSLEKAFRAVSSGTMPATGAGERRGFPWGGRFAATPRRECSAAECQRSHWLSRPEQQRHPPDDRRTNGVVTWHRDVRHKLNRSHQIATFHTPQALAELLDRDFDGATQELLATPNDHPRLRPYQTEANAATEQAIASRKCHMLLAMATGTGKTFTMVNQAYRLMKSGVAKRILFLVDRRALAAQAVRAFASFEPEVGLKFDKVYEVYSQRFFRDDLDDDSRKFDPQVLPSSYLQDPHAGHAFVYVSTIQRMSINLFGRDVIFNVGDEDIDEDADRIDIPIHAFDLIIADECHRGYTSSEVAVWRQTLDHFDAIKIGLTATPAAHTTSYFKDVVFRYEYERAVREGFLVDYDVVAVKSDVRINGNLPVCSSCWSAYRLSSSRILRFESGEVTAASISAVLNWRSSSSRSICFEPLLGSTTPTSSPSSRKTSPW